MPQMVRASFSIEEPLFEKLEELVAESGYENRSEFLRDLIRARLVSEAWEGDEEALGTITLLYDHHTRGLTERLVALQHDHHGNVLVTTHLHLTHALCAEVLLVRGAASAVRTLANALSRERGVLHMALSMSSTGQELPAPQPHTH